MGDRIDQDQGRPDEDIYRLLCKLAAKADVRPAHWISTPDGDDGQDYCPDCGYYLMRHMRRHDRRRNRRRDYILDGGWRTEHDYFPHCTICGVRLDASLTDYGFREALDYFRESVLSPGNPADAHDLCELFLAAEYGLSRGDEDSVAAYEIAREFCKASGMLSGESCHG